MTDGNDYAKRTNAHDYISPQARADGTPDGYAMSVSGGLTKREYFAAIALQGLLSNASLVFELKNFIIDAVTAADALIEVLNKEGK